MQDSASDNAAPKSKALLIVTVVAFVSALLGLVAVQYLMPLTYRSPIGANPFATAHFAGMLADARSDGRLGAREFALILRVLLIVALAAYANLLRLGYRTRVLERRWLLPLVVLLALAFAVFFPPSFSRDVYAYVATGRMQAAGLNPYVDLLADFARSGDAAARVYPLGMPAPYGPAWCLVEALAVRLAPAASLFSQVMVFKLLAALAVIVMALTGSMITQRFEPERADLTLAALGLNPLLLLEGPGNAHNDIFMAALVSVALAAFYGRRRWIAYSTLGLAIAVKYVIVPILPWLAICDVRERQGVQRLVALAAPLLVASAVVLAALLPYGVESGAFGAFAGLRGQASKQWTEARPLAAGTGAALEGADTEDSGAAARTGTSLGVAILFLAVWGGAVVVAWRRRSELTAVYVAIALGTGLLVMRSLVPSMRLGLFVLVPLYVVLTVYVARATGPGRELAAWAMLGAGIVLCLSPVLFPWYWAWPLAVSLTRWTRLHLAITTGVGVLATLTLFMYTVPVAG